MRPASVTTRLASLRPARPSQPKPNRVARHPLIQPHAVTSSRSGPNRAVGPLVPSGASRPHESSNPHAPHLTAPYRTRSGPHRASPPPLHIFTPILEARPSMLSSACTESLFFWWRTSSPAPLCLRSGLHPMDGEPNMPHLVQPLSHECRMASKECSAALPRPARPRHQEPIAQPRSNPAFATLADAC